MNINKYLANTASNQHKRIIRKVSELVKNDAMKQALNEEKWDDVISLITTQSSNWQVAGLFWAIIRASGLDPLASLTFIPLGYYAYNNVDNIDLSGYTNIRLIGDRAFYHSNLSAITLPNSIKTLGPMCFGNITPTSGVLDIFYDGTAAEWKHINKIYKPWGTQGDEPSRRIFCSDKEL